MNAQEIIGALQHAKPSLQKRYRFKAIALFGSFNSWPAGGLIEIMVEFTEPVGMRFIDLEDEVEKLLGHKVTLVARKSLDTKYFKTLKQDMIYI